MKFLKGLLPSGPKVNAQTGTSYTFLDSDTGKLVTFSNASAVAATLPVATAAGFGVYPTGNWSVSVENKGAGSVTITPTTSTIDGSATLVIPQNQGCTITSDGTNYQVVRGLTASTSIPSLVAGSGTTVSGSFGGSDMAVNVAGWLVKTADYTAVKNDRVYVNSASGAVNITAPASPSVGDNFTVARDGANTVTILRNSSTIAGDASDLTLSATGQVASLICTAATTWKVIGGSLK